MNDTPVDFLSQLRLDGRGAIVLGAGQGIGEQSSIALAQAGARVLCVDRDPALAQAIAERVGGVACAADVTQREDMQRIFDTGRREFGRVHTVVDIVGIAEIRPLADTGDDTVDYMFRMVLRHAYLALQIGAPMMAADGGGSLTFVGSMAGNLAVRNQPVYGSAKAALHHLIRSAALEFGARGVRVNGVAPGYVRTPRLNVRLGPEAWDAINATVPLGRAATPAEIAGPLLFLSSDLAAHVNGVVMPVDGGVSVQSTVPNVKFGPMQPPAAR